MLDWFRFRDDRKRVWRCIIANASEMPELEKASGLCVYSQRTIVLNGDTPKRDWDLVVLHEILHASLADTGLQSDETHVDLMSTHGLSMLKQLGFRLPPLPKGTKEVRCKRTKS